MATMVTLTVAITLVILPNNTSQFWHADYIVLCNFQANLKSEKFVVRKKNCLRNGNSLSYTRLYFISASRVA